MNFLFDFLLLIVGFVFLIKGADLLIDGSSSIAKKMKIPTIIIGLTIVAFGTSLPEMVVNIFSSFNGSNDLAIGNIVGSNISNIFLILGVTALIYPLNLGHGTVWKEIPLSLLSVILLFFLVNDALIDGRYFNELSRVDGVVLISFFIIFLYYVFAVSKVEGKDTEEIKKHTYTMNIVLIVIGMVGLTLGGRWIVNSAISIATVLGMSEAFIGLSLVAIGTSLPELATSAVAAYRKNLDLAVGNVVGSNIFNVFWVLGLSSLIRPLQFSITLNADLVVVIAATLMFFIFMHTKGHYRLERWEGGVFVSFYVMYIGYLVWRG